MADANILSDELRLRLGDGGGVPLIVERKAKGAKKEARPPSPKRRKLSNKEKKRLEKLEEKRRKAHDRKKILSSIRANAITEEERKLMQASGRRGQKKSKKEQLKEDLRKVRWVSRASARGSRLRLTPSIVAPPQERIGIELAADSKLYTPVKVRRLCERMPCRSMR